MTTRVPPIYETAKVPNPKDVNNPGTPISCTHQEQNADGTSPNTPPFGGGDVPITIGTVTVATDNASPTVGDTVTYSATNSGTANDVQYTFSAPGENFTGGVVTWANAGATTVTADATSATANPGTAQGTLAVTVAAAPVVPLSLTITANGTTASGGGTLADGGQIGAVYTVNPGGTPESPAFQWAVAGTDAANVVKFKMTVIDQEPNSDGATGNFVHWNIGGSAGGTAPAQLFTTSTSIASTDINTDANGWTPTDCVGQVSDGLGNFTDASAAGMFTNGWVSVGGFGTGTHTYQVTVTGFAADDSELVSGTFSFTHTE